MDCPKCGKILSTIPTSKGAGLLCCGTCCGAWFSKNGLSDYLFEFHSQKPPAGENPEAARSRVVLHPDQTEGFCPDCNRILELHPVAGAGIEISMCRQCGGSFVEFDQLTVLERWYPDASPTGKSTLNVNQYNDDGINTSESVVSGLLGRIEDDNPVRRVPWFTFLLIFANVACFIVTKLVPDAIQWFYLVPDQYLGDVNEHFWQILFCAFGHASLTHLAGNMYFLYVFGDNIEDRIGRPLYAILFFSSAVISSFLHVLLFSQSAVPMIGASGAISGIMGAYLFLYPKTRISIFDLWFHLPVTIKLPAWVFLLIWFFGSNILFFLLKIPGIAWDAHATGFIAGYAGILLFKKLRIY